MLFQHLWRRGILLATGEEWGEERGSGVQSAPALLTWVAAAVLVVWTWAAVAERQAVMWTPQGTLLVPHSLLPLGRGLSVPW